MKDVFYTLVVVWLVWRILTSLSAHRAKKTSAQQASPKKEGKTTVNYVPPTTHKKKNVGDVEDGEYVDFEEVD